MAQVPLSLPSAVVAMQGLSEGVHLWVHHNFEYTPICSGGIKGIACPANAWRALPPLKKKSSKKVAERIEDEGGEEPIERLVVVLYMCGVRPTPSTGSSSLPVQG